jgi:hypothetical protein
MNCRRSVVYSRFPAIWLGLVLPLLASLVPQAQASYRQLNYLNAITALRDARWLTAHRDDGPLQERERHALGDIDRALDDVERVANIDARFVDQRPRDDAYPGPARLQRVSALLRLARADVAQPDERIAWRQGQGQALGHIDDAIQITEAAILERERLYGRDRDRERDVDRR